MNNSKKKMISTLRRNGYKLTPQRIAILDIISSSKGHLTPQDICKKADKRFSGIGLVTTYRTLEILSQLNLICRLHLDNKSHNYLMRRPAEHHHHLICSRCGIVRDLTQCNLNEIQQSISAETGFEITSHLLEFQGICPECQQITSFK